MAQRPGAGNAPPAAPGDEAAPDPRQLAAQLELVQRELARTQARLDSIEAAMVEANQAAATLRALADESSTGDLLVPVGAGVHVHARLVKGQPPVVPVGAGYAIEASPQAALATLERRIQDITETFNQAAERAEQLAQAGSQITAMLGGNDDE